MAADQCQKHCTPHPASGLGAAYGVREGATLVCENATGLGINTGALRSLRVQIQTVSLGACGC